MEQWMCSGLFARHQLHRTFHLEKGRLARSQASPLSCKLQDNICHIALINPDIYKKQMRCRAVALTEGPGQQRLDLHEPFPLCLRPRSSKNIWAGTALSAQRTPLALRRRKTNVVRYSNTNTLRWLRNQTQWRSCVWNLVNNSWMEYGPTQCPIAVVTL